MDDLIDISEGFAGLIKAGDIVKSDALEGFLTAEEATEQTNRMYVKFYDIDGILVVFGQFTHEYLYGDYSQTVDRLEEWRMERIISHYVWSIIQREIYFSTFPFPSWNRGCRRVL